MGHRCYTRRSSVVGLWSSAAVRMRRAGDGGRGHCGCCGRENGRGKHRERKSKQRLDNAALKALIWFWLIDETLSANLVYQGDYEIGSTTPSDEAMAKIMTTVIAW